MKKYVFFFFLSFCSVGMVSAQFTDDFSDSAATYSSWKGDWHHFAINRFEVLQSNCKEAAHSVLFHANSATIQANWEFQTRISGTVSAYNYVCFYPVLSNDNEQSDGYYIRVGGRKKNITLNAQIDGISTTVIESQQRLNILQSNSFIIWVKLTRGEDGIFHLYSMVEGLDSVYVEEGSYFADYISSEYVAWVVHNSKQRGYDYYLDDVLVEGNIQISPIPTQKSTSNIELSMMYDSFSPNMDGYQDEACMLYSTVASDYTLSIQIFTADAIPVLRLPTQDISDMGQICWDGRLADGSLAPVGIYVWDIEARSKDTSHIERKRFAVALTH